MPLEPRLSPGCCSPSALPLPLPLLVSPSKKGLQINSGSHSPLLHVWAVLSCAMRLSCHHSDSHPSEDEPLFGLIAPAGEWFIAGLSLGTLLNRLSLPWSRAIHECKAGLCNPKVTSKHSSTQPRPSPDT